MSLTCAAIAHNLTRAAGALAGGRHTRARTATLRTQLIHTPARVAHSAHHQTLHLPRVALGTRPRRTVPPGPARPPPSHRLTTVPQGPTGNNQWKSRTDRRTRNAPSQTASRKINSAQRRRSTVDPGRGNLLTSKR
jgi:hypothetical protein